MTQTDTPLPHRRTGKGSRKARQTAARLAAVQAVYEILATDRQAEDVLAYTLAYPPADNEMVAPDPETLCRIVLGLDREKADMAALVSRHLDSLPAEWLLRAVLLCGTWELARHEDIDAPLIISDYMDVTEAFFESGEKKLVNAVLDSVNKELRHG